MAEKDISTDLEGALRDALGHLYDPSHWPLGPLWVATGCDPAHGAEPIRQAIIAAIESLRPAPGTPADVRLRRIYDLLHLRYVQNLTSEETAQRLNISSRHLRREQQEAIALLARRLARLSDQMAATPAPAGQAPSNRLAQLHQELASLQKAAPGSVTNVGEVLREVMEVGQTLAARHGVEMVLSGTPPDLLASLHPSALRQALLTAIGALLEKMLSGRITLASERAAGSVAISVTGQPLCADRPPDADLIAEILAAQGGSLDVRTGDDQTTFWLLLRPADEITVLVIDDNTDLVHFYRRYTAGTRYRIADVARGQHALESAEALSPQIIVLDVMLPDMDGWQLLSQLHAHPATCAVPIIVCSVIAQPELALALGATLCLRKPVSQSEFVQALDQAAGQTRRNSW